MRAYVDTSAFLAVMDADDENHAQAAGIWKGLLESDAVLVCNNYVLLESYTLIQHRLGMNAVKAFHRSVRPYLQVEWIDQLVHKQAVDAMVMAERRKLSLVDCTSFLSIRKIGLQSVFAFDRHFEEQGFFCLVPS